MRKTKISVAMCTYNSGNYLEEQLSSILCQTMLPDEIVIIDDCSSDHTNNIIDGFKTKYPFTIIHIINSANLGYLKNFEKAILHCNGDVIFFSDHDDLWESQKVEKIYNYFFRHPKISMVFTDGKLMSGSSKIINGTLWEKFIFTKKNQQDFLKNPLSYLLKRDTVTGATVAIRKNLIDEVVPFPKEFVHDTWCALIAASQNKLSLVPECLIRYRVHSTQQIGLNNRTFSQSIKRKSSSMLEKLIVLKERAIMLNCCQESIEQIDEKLRFYQERNNYSTNMKQRMFSITRNYTLYRKYASGMLSMMKDLLRSEC